MILKKNVLPELQDGALQVGLGCSRLGSINGASADEARALINRALDAGIRFFDTSNIYAQGDSERLLGEVLGRRDDCIICSKAGKYLDWKKRALLPLKGLIRATVKRSSKASEGVRTARAKPMPMRWDEPFLTRSIEQSLRRIGRPRIEMFMLHSPNAKVIEDGEAVGALEGLRGAGKLGIIGVSVDDVETAIACLKDARIKVMQVPIRPGEAIFNEVIHTAALSGVRIIAREILSGHNGIASVDNSSKFLDARISEIIAHPDISLPLVGTTKMKNLDALIASAKRR